MPTYVIRSFSTWKSTRQPFLLIIVARMRCGDRSKPVFMSLFSRLDSSCILCVAECIGSCAQLLNTMT